MEEASISPNHLCYADTARQHLFREPGQCAPAHSNDKGRILGSDKLAPVLFVTGTSHQDGGEHLTGTPEW